MEVGEGQPVAVREQVTSRPPKPEEKTTKLFQEIEERRQRIVEVIPTTKNTGKNGESDLDRALGFPPFIEMTPEEISEDDELLFHSTPEKRAIELLARGSIDSKIAQKQKYGVIARKTPGDSESKDPSISFCRGGTYSSGWGSEGMGTGITFAFRAREILPGTLFNETDYDPGEIRIFNSDFEPKQPETTEGSSVSFAENDFIILVGKPEEAASKVGIPIESGWFSERIRENWHNFPEAIKSRYKDSDEFIEKHVVEQPKLYERRITNWLEENRPKIMDSFEGVRRDIDESCGGSYEWWAFGREKRYLRTGGLGSYIRHVINDYDRENPQGIAWNFAEQLLALRMLEQEFNRRFPPKAPRSLVKVEETDKKFGFRGETPLRKAIRINP